MNLCVILRRNGWPTPDQPRAAPRRSIEEGDRDPPPRPGLAVVAHDAALTMR